MKSILYLSLVSLIAISCSTAKMAVSEELKESNDEYKVKGKNGNMIKQKMSFGEYNTASIKRSWTKGSSSRMGIGQSGPTQDDWVNIISVEYINRKQTVKFKLAENDRMSEVYCVSRFNAKTLEIGKTNSLLNIGIDLLGAAGKSESNFYVQIFENETDDRPWEMLIDNQLAQQKRKDYIGYLAKSKTEYYSIVPVYHMETSKGKKPILGGSIGFEFRDPAGKSVAAVSMLDNGMVILAKGDAKERFLLANACTALLLQEVIG